jgi:hypothetical protein
MLHADDGMVKRGQDSEAGYVEAHQEGRVHGAEPRATGVEPRQVPGIDRVVAGIVVRARKTSPVDIT